MAMASASGYNHHRFARSVLKKSRKWEPSLAVQLFPNHWRFENSPMTFPYQGPMTPFLLALRAQVIPASLVPFLYDIRPPVSFVDGCLVVELQDFRKQPESRTRIVMRPAPEALAQTIDVMLERKGEGGDDMLALELESRIIAATSPPLYLGTSIIATRNAALALALTAPAAPNLSADGTHRNPQSISTTDEKSEVERMRKLLRAGLTEKPPGGFQPTWSVLRMKEIVEQKKLDQATALAEGQAATSTAAAADAEPETKPKKKKKRPAEEEPKEETTTKKVVKKKKVTAAAAAAAAAAATTATGSITVKEETPKKKPPETKDKPKKKVVKKKE